MTQPENDPLPQVLACCGLSLMFCVKPDIWPQFRAWLEERNFPVTEEFVMESVTVLNDLIREVNDTLIAQKLDALLTEIDDSAR